MRTRSMTVLLAAVLLAGCPADRESGAPLQDTIPAARAAITPEARVQLDSGNAAYEQERYRDALAFYEAAAQLDPGAAAVWFGVYMAHSALGNTAEADAAMERARAAAPGGDLRGRLPEEPGIIPVEPAGSRP